LEIDPEGHEMALWIHSNKMDLRRRKRRRHLASLLDEEGDGISAEGEHVAEPGHKETLSRGRILRILGPVPDLHHMEMKREGNARHLFT